MSTDAGRPEPVLTAVSSSVRQLFLLLRCINFSTKAHVRIMESGLHFTAEDSRVMQGSVLLERSLFSSYTFSPPAIWHDGSTASDASSEPDFDSYVLQINLSALLETLQILFLNDSSFPRGHHPPRDGLSSTLGTTLSRGGPSATMFSARVLDAPSICRLSYSGAGTPLRLVLCSAGISTTCTLTTYEPDPQADIPLRKDALVMKIIMRAALLHDAIAELEAAAATRLVLAASPTRPHFSLSAAGPHASAAVEFAADAQLLETFQVPARVTAAYSFALVKAAARAMAMASKVSVRADRHGVLSLQFMIELEAGAVSFVDFKFVALLDEAEDEDEDEDERGGAGDDGIDEGEADDLLMDEG